MTLSLIENQIGDQGAQDIIEALRNNMVILILFLFLSYRSSSLHIDIDHTISWRQSNRRRQVRTHRGLTQEKFSTQKEKLIITFRIKYLFMSSITYSEIWRRTLIFCERYGASPNFGMYDTAG